MRRLSAPPVATYFPSDEERNDYVDVPETKDQEMSAKGIINDIKVFERGDRGKGGLCVVVATGKEHRFGRWKTLKGKNGAVIFEVSSREPATNGVKPMDVDNSEIQSKT